MSEFRQDRTSGRWTIIAPERGHRPREWAANGRPHTAPEAFDPDCPFCPGNEAMLPEIVEERRAEKAPLWSTRVVPNKYPAVLCNAEQAVHPHGIYLTAIGHGCHEVVIESPRHNADLTMVPDEAVAAVLATYGARYRTHMQHPDIRSVVVFRNHGAAAGASLRHPHSQIIATSMVPPAMETRQAWARRQYEASGRCVVCEVLAFEAARRERIVLDGTHFLAFVPFAACGPYELWLVPKRHQTSFSDLSDEEQIELARLLRRALLKLKHTLDDPPYNYVIESTSKGFAGAPHLHWYLRILPNLIRTGGFELASGLAINPSIPEADAAVLRKADPASEEASL